MGLYETHELPTSRDVAESLIVNSAFAVQVMPESFGRRGPLLSETRWVRANRKLLADIGAEAYLKLLLRVLKGDDPAVRYKHLIEANVDQIFGKD